MKIKPIPPIVFGYHSTLKTQWIKGNLPTVKYGIYGGELTKKTISLEHIKPLSKGGKTKLYNLALATKENNNLRANYPLKNYLDSDKFIRYIEQFKDIDLPALNGKEYIKNLIKTIIDTLEGK